ncbi:hypothetical protein [Nocardiopsis ansamitocini]|uniref:Chaplin n=1 Tax=Nocardiopsis ansamitocini TaxID=1670832 RepID=A0A9W6P834_9ACTN|nr:hypothetical protein [Nocardiopsis ansamitocini]GLU49259.1 hypothetical protein Nans01_36100 [Nocardiopsis ansamitocini]
MLRKFAAATAIAGAALAFSAAPALAHNHGDQNYNQNLQVVSAAVCNANVGAAIGVVVPVLSPQFAGDCTSGPIQTVVN